MWLGAKKWVPRDTIWPMNPTKILFLHIWALFVLFPVKAQSKDICTKSKLVSFFITSLQTIVIFVFSVRLFLLVWDVISLFWFAFPYSQLIMSTFSYLLIIVLTLRSVFNFSQFLDGLYDFFNYWVFWMVYKPWILTLFLMDCVYILSYIKSGIT